MSTQRFKSGVLSGYSSLQNVQTEKIENQQLSNRSWQRLLDLVIGRASCSHDGKIDTLDGILKTVWKVELIGHSAHVFLRS